MISSVRGTVLGVAGTTAVIEVGGVGLAVHVTPQQGLALRTGAEARLHTALIVREDDLSLYGFADTEELAVFDLLRGVTGVGPKSALGVLAVMTPADISQAVAVEDDGAFRKVSGIGPKTAKLIVVSLAGKLSIVSAASARAGAAGSNATAKQSVIVALVGLGWAERTAILAVDEALASATDAERTEVPALLRLALASLGPQQFAGSASQ
jgi:Holliday junction DNA helicase RuvA